MIDINFIRKHPEKVKESAKNKGVSIDIDKILKLDMKRKKLLTQRQRYQQERNTLSKEEGIKKGKSLKEKIRGSKKQLEKINSKYKDALYEIPNIAEDDVKVGKDESENETIRTWGAPAKFDFNPKDHVELGELHDILDIKRSSKVSGSRFGYLKNQLVSLEFAIIQLAFRILTEEGFIPILPPVLIKKDITKELGYWQGQERQEYYLVKEPNSEEGEMYLVGTAEHSVVPYFKDEILQREDLPIRFAAFSSAFRRESGSYGKAVQGIFRVHQFDKVEMVVFTRPEESKKELEYLLSLEEVLFRALEIPYRVVKMCTGDLGFPASKKYDIEAWMPSQDRYREVTSASSTSDFQSRRLNIRYKTGDKTRPVHILNGTGFAIGRTIIAIIENFQQKDGSIRIPKALHPHLNFTIIG